MCRAATLDTWHLNPEHENHIHTALWCFEYFQIYFQEEASRRNVQWSPDHSVLSHIRPIRFEQQKSSVHPESSFYTLTLQKGLSLAYISLLHVCICVPPWANKLPSFNNNLIMSFIALWHLVFIANCASIEKKKINYCITVSICALNMKESPVQKSGHSLTCTRLSPAHPHRCLQ